MKLKIADDLSLPLDVVTQTIAVLAKRRAGKSYTMRRIVEQLFRAGQQVVLVDPKGDQWGLRSASNGKDPGLAIVILGGEKGDVPLESSSGEIVAKLVVEERVSVLLDLSLFRKHEVATFMTAFMENLYRLKAKEIYRTPMMLVIDEADAVAPQKPQKGEERMLGAAEDIVRRGGQRGIGCVLVTQRSAVLNKNVLTQAQVLIVLRTIAPQDLTAMKAWIDVHGDEAQGAELMASLPSLPVGDAWFWSPGWPTTDGIFKRVHVLPIETFDSGKSPDPNEKKRAEPKNMADVDLEALKGQMAATIEKAKADDPRELKKQIADLKKQVEQAGKQSAQIAPISQVKRVEVLTESDRALLRKMSDGIGNIKEFLVSAGAQLEAEAQARFVQALAILRDDAAGDVARMRAEFERRLDLKGFQKILAKLSTVSPEPDRKMPGQIVPTGTNSTPRYKNTTANPQRVSSRVVDTNGDLTKAEQRVVDAVGWWRNAAIGNPSRHQVAFVAGYTVNGHFNNLVGGLRTKGLVDYPPKGGVALTDAGLALANLTQDNPTRADLIQRVLGVLEPSPGRIFAAVADADRDLTREELAAMTGYTVNGHFNNMVGSLRSLGVIDYPHQGGVRLGEMFEGLA